MFQKPEELERPDSEQAAERGRVMSDRENKAESLVRERGKAALLNKFWSHATKQELEQFAWQQGIYIRQ